MKNFIQSIFNPTGSRNGNSPQDQQQNKVMETKHNTKGWTAKESDESGKNAGVKPGVTKVHNLLIVDESGSMSSLYRAALTGMNETLNTIKEAEKQHPEQAQEVTLVTFDTGHYNEIFSSVPASKTREITERDYRPGGGTPLYDAMGKALTDLERKVKENEAVLVTVITDGYENASCEYSLADIRALVERLDEAGWMFAYIGANQDSAAVGNSMGITDTLDFMANEADMDQMWKKENSSRRAFMADVARPDFNPKTYRRGNFFGK